MRDLPTRGRCHAAFLLAYSARVKECKDFNSWIAAALAKPTHMAASLDLKGTAKLLIDSGIARVEPFAITVGDLAKLDRVADLTTFKAIARLLLVRRPPDWLRSAVVDGHLAEEYIPEEALKAISWLDRDLEAIIVASHQELFGAADDAFLKCLGNAGELAVMSALRHSGFKPRHVSLISDRFGYDIELEVEGRILGLEVKTAFRSTANKILLSRNEFEVAHRMGVQWNLIQVTFSSRILASQSVSFEDVERIRKLRAHWFSEVAPKEQEMFRWIDTAEFRPPDAAWDASDLVVAQEFKIRL
jgi:Domain of unknown function (DUF3883)